MRCGAVWLWSGCGLGVVWLCCAVHRPVCSWWRWCPAPPLPAPPTPPAPQGICSVIYAGERVSTDLQEVNAVAKMLISKYRCVGGWCVCGVCFGGVGVCVWVGGGGGTAACQPRGASVPGTPPDGGSMRPTPSPFPSPAHPLASCIPHSPPACTQRCTLCSGPYKERGFPHNVVSDTYRDEWQVNADLAAALAVCAPPPLEKLKVRLGGWAEGWPGRGWDTGWSRWSAWVMYLLTAFDCCRPPPTAARAPLLGPAVCSFWKTLPPSTACRLTAMRRPWTCCRCRSSSRRRPPWRR